MGQFFIMTILDFFIRRWNHWPLAIVERLFWQLGKRFSGRCLCREVVVAEILKQESGTPNEKIVQNHLKIALLKYFSI